MNQRSYTAAEDEIIRANFGRIPDMEIAAMLTAISAYPRSERAVGRRAERLKLKRGPGVKRVGSNPFRNPFAYTAAEDEVIRALYPTTPTEVIARMLPGRSVHSVRTRASGMGVAKSREFILAQKTGPRIDRQELKRKAAESANAEFRRMRFQALVARRDIFTMAATIGGVA